MPAGTTSELLTPPKLLGVVEADVAEQIAGKVILSIDGLGLTVTTTWSVFVQVFVPVTVNVYVVAIGKFVALIAGKAIAFVTLLSQP